MEAVPVPATSGETTIARELLAGVIGTAVALACVLPPLVHLVSGPLGPLIGGAVAARWLGPSERGRLVIAGTIGACLAGIGAAVAGAIVTFGGAPSWFPPAETLALILMGVAAYGAGLGAIGATLGARWSRPDVAPPQSAGAMPPRDVETK